MPKNEPSLTSMQQMVLEISHIKFRNLSKLDVSLIFKYDVIDGNLHRKNKTATSQKSTFSHRCGRQFPELIFVLKNPEFHWLMPKSPLGSQSSGKLILTGPNWYDPP